MNRLQNPNRFKPAFLQKPPGLWLRLGIVFILLYSGYQAKLTHSTFRAEEQFLITDNLSLEHPNIPLFFTDSKTLYYYEGETVFRPLFTLGLSLDHQFRNPWVFRFHSWFLFVILCGMLYCFPIKAIDKTTIPKYRKYKLMALTLLTLLPSTTAVLGNVVHRSELSATVFLLIGFSTLNRNRSWATLLAIFFFVSAGLTHELAWAFLVPLGFYLWKKSFNEMFGILWCVSFSLWAFWLVPSSSPFAETGFMMSVSMFCILPPLLQYLNDGLRFRTLSISRKPFSLLLGMLFITLLHIPHSNPNIYTKPSIQQQFNAGIELIAAHEWKSALHHFERLHEKAPYHRPTLLKLLDTYHALECWANLKGLSSQVSEQQYLSEITKEYQEIATLKKSRIIVLEEAFVANPTVQNALPLANECYRRGEYAQSAHFARWILKLEPNSEEGLHQLGEAYVKLGNHHDAKLAFQKAAGLTHVGQTTLAATQ